MATPCMQCSRRSSGICFEPCETYKRWLKNPAEFEKKMNAADLPADAKGNGQAAEELPAGVYPVRLSLIRDDVCAQDCMDLSRTIEVRSDRTMADIDDELRRTWLPKGYNWTGGTRIGTAGEYVRSSQYKSGTLRYTHR